MGKFIIKKGANDQYSFVLKAGNGEPILSSELYTSKDACNNGIESVKVNSQDDEKYKRLQARGNQFYFNLIAANGQIIGTSEMYKSEQGRDNGIESVKKNAPEALVEENI